MSFLIKPAEIAVTSAIAVKYALDLDRAMVAVLGSDRRTFEREADNMREVLNNPPAKTSKKATHNDYQRKANDALIWIKKNIPEEYEAYEAAYKDYLMSTVETDDGAWSNGIFSHQYSHGAPDSSFAERTERITNILLKPAHAILALCDGTHHNEIQAHIRGTHQARHEEEFRHLHGMSNTPPPQL